MFRVDEVRDESVPLFFAVPILNTTVLSTAILHTAIPVARGRLATGTPSLDRANPPLATGIPPPLVVALDKTALGREAAVTR